MCIAIDYGFLKQKMHILMKTRIRMGNNEMMTHSSMQINIIWAKICIKKKRKQKHAIKQSNYWKCAEIYYVWMTSTEYVS